jgi:O-antigen ligase
MLKVFYYIALFSLCLGQLLSIGKSDGINLYIFDVAVAIFAFIGVSTFILAKNFIVPKYFYFLIPFTLVAFLSLIFNKNTLSTSEFLVALSYLLRLVSYTLAGLTVYNMLISKVISEQTLKTSLYFAGILVGVGGIIQLIILPDFTVLNPELGWDPHQNRLASTFFDPNFVGAFFNIIIAFLLNDMKTNKQSGFIYSTFLFLVTCVFLTFSRSAWGMLGIIIFLFGLFHNRKLLYAAFIIVFLAYFAVPRVQTRISGITDPADSASYRLESWSNALSLSKDNWFIGVGFNAYKYAQLNAGLLNGDSYFAHSATGADSSFLFVLVTTGVLGLLFFTLWWGMPLLEQLRYGTKGDLVLISVLLGLLLESQFINSVFYPQILFLLMIVFARSSHVRN